MASRPGHIDSDLGSSRTSVSIMVLPTSFTLRGIHTFTREIALALWRMRQQQIGELVRHEAVDLLGHRAIAGAQAGLDVRHSDAQLRRRPASPPSSSSRRRRRSPSPDAGRARPARTASSPRPSARRDCPTPLRDRDPAWAARARRRRPPTCGRRSADPCGRVSAAGRRPAIAWQTGAAFMKLGRAPTTWRMCTKAVLRSERDFALLLEAAARRERHAHGGVDLVERDRRRAAGGNRLGKARPAGGVPLVAFEIRAPSAGGSNAAGQFEPGRNRRARRSCRRRGPRSVPCRARARRWRGRESGRSTLSGSAASTPRCRRCRRRGSPSRPHARARARRRPSRSPSR